MHSDVVRAHGGSFQMHGGTTARRICTVYTLTVEDMLMAFCFFNDIELFWPTCVLDGPEHQMQQQRQQCDQQHRVSP